MPLSWIAPVAGALGGLLSDGGGGQQAGQTQTVSKDPWSVAAPWLTENVSTGQALQNHYQNSPFNPMQQLGYKNQSSNADYMRSLTSGVLGQLNNSTYFDRGNPNARPQAFQFPTVSGKAGGAGSAYAGPSATGPITDGQYTYQPGGSTGWQANINGAWTDLNPGTTDFNWLNGQRGLDMNVANNPFANGGIRAPAPVAAPVAQQTMPLLNWSGGSDGVHGDR